MSPVHSGESRTWSSVVAESCLLPQLRQFQTSCHRCDIDQAAKYIGAGAATVGVAGSGLWHYLLCFLFLIMFSLAMSGKPKIDLDSV